MKKIYALIKLTYFLITDYRKLSYALVNMSKEEACKRKVINKYRMSNALPQVGFTDLLGPIDSTLYPYTFMDGVAPVTDMILLKELSRKYDVKTFVELGTWRGESTANIAPYIEKGVTISFSEEEMLSRNFVPKSALKASRMFIKDISNIETIKHDTQTFDYSNLMGKVDMVFVDADHSYEGVLKDTRNAYSVLKGQDSIIVWHDYGHTNENTNWQVLCAILDGIPEEDHKNLYHVSNTLCAVLIRDNLQTSSPEPFYPRDIYEVSVRSKTK